MNTVLAYIVKLFMQGILEGIFSYLGERSRDRDLVQSGIDRAERENAIKAANRATRVAQAAAARRSNADTAGSMRDGSF